MTFDEALSQAIDMLRRNGRVSYRALRRQFGADDGFLDDLRAEIVDVLRLATDEDGQVLVLAEGRPAPPAPRPDPQPPAEPPRSAEAAAQAEPAALRLPEGERRHLAAMFCDLVDSTGLSTRLDPEELGDIYSAWQDIVAAVVQPFGGHIQNFMGDGSLVTFGYPVAHEDSAERSVSAALAIQAALAQRNAERGGDAPALAARVGIHYGLVLLSDLGGRHAARQFAVGQTPNIAARLQSLAEPGGIVISGAVKSLLKDRFLCRALGRQALKGVDHPVDVYAVTGEAQAGRESFPAGQPMGGFVGRDAEIAVLDAAWARVGEGFGQAVLISGQAGIGKSRLVDAAVARAGPQARRARMRCSALHTASVLHPVVELLRREAGIGQREAADEAMGKLRALLSASLGGRAAEAEDTIAPLLSIRPHRVFVPEVGNDMRRARAERLGIIAEVLLRGEEPRILVVEDLQWADPTTVELLGQLLGRIGDKSVLLLMTARPDFRPEWPQRSDLGRIALQRLSRRDAAALVRAAPRGAPLPPAVEEQVLARGDGVPLFLEELVAMLADAPPGDDAAALSAIPETLQATLAARLGRLGEARETAQVAAALGREFPETLLQAVSRHDAATLKEHLDSLVSAELLQQQARADGVRYWFRHALMQDAAYQSLLKARRQAIHRDIARALKRSFAGLVELQPEFAAHHFTEAGLVDEAAERWHAAGERALRRWAQVEALRHIDRGLGLLEAAPATAERQRRAMALNVCKGSALLLTRGQAAEEVGAAFARARALSVAIGAEGDLALLPVLYGLWRFYLGRSAMEEALDAASDYAALAGRTGEPAIVAAGSMALGLTLFNLGRLREALIHLDAGVAAHEARGGEDRSASIFLIGQDPLMVCLLTRAVTLLLLERPEAAAADAGRAAAIVKKTPFPFNVAVANAWLANYHQLRGDMDGALEAAERAQAICTEHDFAMWRGASRVLVAVARLGKGGDPTVLLDEIRAGEEQLRSTGSVVLSTRNMALLARGCLQAGRLEEGLLAVRQGLSDVGRHGERWWTPELHRLEGELARAMGDDVMAEACFERAVASARDLGAARFEQQAAEGLARCRRVTRATSLS